MKELEEMTGEELEAELNESFKNIRKIEILENLPFTEWNKDELIEVIIDFALRKCCGSLEEFINTIPEFVKSGLYRKYKKDFEKHKIMETTKEMKKELSMKEANLRPHFVLKDIAFDDWNRIELL